MPIRKGKDEEGKYEQYGPEGKKYRGKGAHSKAARQGRAIEDSKHAKGK